VRSGNSYVDYEVQWIWWKTNNLSFRTEPPQEEPEPQAPKPEGNAIAGLFLSEAGLDCLEAFNLARTDFNIVANRYGLSPRGTDRQVSFDLVVRARDQAMECAHVLRRRLRVELNDIETAPE
jgi:hypothetical protein